MIRSNNSSQSGYIKLQQESEIYEDEDWPDHNHNNKYIFPNKTRCHQSRSLSDSRHSRVEFQISSNEMEAAPHESERIDTRDSNDSESNSAWSQFSKRLKIKGKKGKQLNKAELETYKSVFELIPTLQNYKLNVLLLTPNHEEALTKQKFDEIVDSVKAAIATKIQPTRISQGSSGSYFCRNKEGKVVGVFKPKNEEPYGRLNPKWTKWIHRNLFPCFFGRSCLIPNLGYISESAASLLDRRLSLNIVPVTEVIGLSSPSFHYDYLDRLAAKSKPLPNKTGSFQVFLDGFKDANIFLREHPWPEHNDNNAAVTTTETDMVGNTRQNRRLNPLMCGRSGVTGDDEETSESYQLGRRFVWTPELQLQFREQFEKLVILDYLMRNTDRGSDNWMIKYCDKDEQACIRNTPPTSKTMKVPDILTKDNVLTHSKDNETAQDVPPPLSPDGSEPSTSSFSEPLHLDNQDKLDNPLEPISSVSSPPSVSSQTDINSSRLPYPHIHVAAIDNGLSFPFKHPDQWRSYPYGWLYLSHSLVRQPFTTSTRNHFLSMLSNPKWWNETVRELYRLFKLDSDFEPGMFARQIAVLKGQGWNIVETLKNPDQGPLDLCEKRNVMIWDDVKTIEISPEIDQYDGDVNGVDINNSGRIPEDYEEGEDDISLRTDGYIPAPRRSLSEGNSEREHSLSASAPASSPFSATSFSKQKWSKIREKLNFDNVGKNKDNNSSLEGKQTKEVTVERLEYVKGGTPFFTWC